MQVMTATEIRKRLRVLASAEEAKVLQWFFKTGPGEYGEGDVFIGVRVPALRQLVRECPTAGEPAAKSLLQSRVHEDRLLALLLLVRQFANGDGPTRERTYRLYLDCTDRINHVL